MTDDIEFAVRAIDENSKVLNDANAKVGKLDNSLQNAEKSAKKSSFSFTELNSAIGLVKQGVDVAGQAFDATVGKLIGYANEVRALNEINGQSAESNSRLIQVLDDHKISLQDLMTTQKELMKDGKVMSSEFLADVADKYNAATTQVDKNKVAQDNLGRSWKSYIELLGMGGEAIRAESDAVSDNLILSQKQIDQAREVEKAWDGLSDAGTGLAMVMSKALLPAVKDLTKFLQDGAEGWAEYFADREVYLKQEALTIELMKQEGIEIPKNDQMRGRWTAANKELIQSFREQAAAQIAAEAATREQTAAGEAYIPTAEEMAEAAKALTAEFTGQLSLIGNMQRAEESYQNKASDLAVEREKIEADKAAAIAQGWQIGSDKIRAYDDSLEANTRKTQENKEAFDRANLEIMSGLIERKLLADGQLDNKEFEYLLALRQEWGLYSADVVEKARAAWQEADKIAQSINNIPTSRDVYFTVHYSDPQAQPGGYGYQYGSNAGKGQNRPHAAGGEFMIPMSYGNEGFRMGNGGDTASGGERVTIAPRGTSDGNAALLAAIDRNRIDYGAFARAVASEFMRMGG